MDKIRTYGGKIPKTLLAYCEKLNKDNDFQVVFEIGNEPDSAVDGNNSYWILSGAVTFNAMGCGTIHEDTVKRCIDQLKLGFIKDQAIA